MTDACEMTEKEKEAFFKDETKVAGYVTRALKPEGAFTPDVPVIEKKVSTYKPIFGEYFKERMVASLEGSVYDPEKTYKVIEQETVAYIADIIKDFGASLIVKIKNRF